MSSANFTPAAVSGVNCPSLNDALQQAQPLEGQADKRLSETSDTKRAAFHSLSPAHYLQPKERAVMALFTSLAMALSRQQISELAPMPLHGVCGRVDSLLSAGHLEEFGTRIDPTTGKRQKLLRLPRPVQASLLEQVSAYHCARASWVGGAA